MQSLSSRVSGSQRHAQDSVSAELALCRSAVELEHLIVEAALVEHVPTLKGRSDDIVDVGNSLQDALAAETILVTIAKLKSLVLTSAGTRWNTCTAHYAVLECYLNLYCRIATGIQNLTCVNL